MDGYDSPDELAAEHGLRLLERDRALNDRKLKSTFEHIFEKYGHDFDGIGDEIDIATGEIVIDNGHLQYMRDEVDPSNSASASFVKSFQKGLELEDSDELSEEADDLDSVDDVRSDEGSSEEESIQHAEGIGDFAGLLGALSRPAPRLARLLVGDGSSERPFELTDDLHDRESSVSGSTSGRSTPSEISQLVPELGKTVEYLRSMSKRRAMDEEAIQTLGMSIANQLAGVVNGQAPRRSKKRPKLHFKDKNWEFPEFDEIPRARRNTSLSRVSTPTVITRPSVCSPGKGSIWAESADARKRRRLNAQSLQEHTVDRLDTGSATTRKHARELSLHTPSVATNKQDVRRKNASLGRTRDHRNQTHSRMPDASREIRSRSQSPVPAIKIEQAHQGFTVVTSSATGHKETHQDAPQVPKSQREPSAHTDESSVVHASSRRSRHIRSTLPIDSGRPPTREGTRAESGNASEELVVMEQSQPGYLANTSRMLCTDDMNVHSPFTAVEDSELIRLREIDQLSWEGISRQLPGRTPYTVQRRYSKYLCNKDTPGRDLFQKRMDETRTAVDKSCHDAVLRADPSWTDEQDEVLLELREDRELKWQEVSEQMPSKTPMQIRQRYALLTETAIRNHKQARGRATDGVVKETKPFTTEEEALIIRLREVESLQWKDIAVKVPGRTISSVQKHYVRSLRDRKRTTGSGTSESSGGVADGNQVRSSAALTHAAFTPGDDEFIKRLREDGNLEWDKIASLMSGKTVQSIRDRYMQICSKQAKAVHPRQNMTVDESREGQTSHTATSPQIRNNPPTQSHALTAPMVPAAQNVPDVPLPSDDRDQATSFSTSATLQDTASRDELLASGVPLWEIDSHCRRYTKRENELILGLRDRNMSWTDISERMYKRSPGALHIHWNSVLKSASRKGPPTTTPTGSHFGRNTLLRRAIDNNVRRQCDSNTNRLLSPTTANGITRDGRAAVALQSQSILRPAIARPDVADHDSSSPGEAAGLVSPQDSRREAGDRNSDIDALRQVPGVRSNRPINFEAFPRQIEKTHSHVVSALGKSSPSALRESLSTRPLSSETRLEDRTSGWINSHGEDTTRSAVTESLQKSSTARSRRRPRTKRIAIEPWQSDESEAEYVPSDDSSLSSDEESLAASTKVLRRSTRRSNTHLSQVNEDNVYHIQADRRMKSSTTSVSSRRKGDETPRFPISGEDAGVGRRDGPLSPEIEDSEDEDIVVNKRSRRGERMPLDRALHNPPAVSSSRLPDASLFDLSRIQISLGELPLQADSSSPLAIRSQAVSRKGVPANSGPKAKRHLHSRLHRKEVTHHEPTNEGKPAMQSARYSQSSRLTASATHARVTYLKNTPRRHSTPTAIFDYRDSPTPQRAGTPGSAVRGRASRARSVSDTARSGFDGTRRVVNTPAPESIDPTVDELA